MSREYIQKVPKLDAYKNIYIDIDGIKKICSKCGGRKLLNYENYSLDSQKPYGYVSQCRVCKRGPAKIYNYKKRNGLL